MVILCWRNREYLPALLRSLARQGVSMTLDVTVCHNEAKGDQAQAAQSQGWPAGLDVHEIYTGGNLGYGAGNNLALEQVRRRLSPAYFLVLNSDVVLHEQALEEALKWADAHPQVSVVGALHEDPSRPGYRCFGGSRYNRVWSLITPNEAPAESRLDYVHGAAMLLRADVFPAGPIFAEHYFLFFEELELAQRVRAMGHAIGYCPGFRVLHHEGGSRRTVHDDFVPEVAEYFENLNALRLTREHWPHWLLTVLLFRGLAKPAWLALHGQWLRLRFWALALADFACGRVRRFPFQKGWSLPPGKERLVDAKLPGMST